MFELQPHSCHDCGSVTGVSAYLADLLDFLNACITKPDDDPRMRQTALMALTAQRPDLDAPGLCCADSNALVPYIVTVNETLEAFIAARISKKLDIGGSGSCGDLVEEEEHSGNKQTRGDVSRHIFSGPLAEQVFPFDVFPFNQARDSIKTYLSAFGLTPLDVLQTFRSPGAVLGQFSDLKPLVATSPLEKEDMLEAATWVCDRAVVAELLGLDPLGFAAITGETIYPISFLDKAVALGEAGGDSGAARNAHWIPPVHTSWGYASSEAMLDDKNEETGGLGFIRTQFLPRSGLSFQELNDLVNGLYFKRRLVITNSDSTRPVAGDLSEMRLCSFNTEEATAPDTDLEKSSFVGRLTKELCQELQSFIRLKKALGWSIIDLDIAISALTENQVANSPSLAPRCPGISVRLLESLANTVRLSRLVQVPVVQLLPLWSTIDFHGKTSLYHQLFVGPGRILLHDQFFKPDEGPPLARAGTIQHHSSTLQAALNLNHNDFDSLLLAAGIEGSERLTIDSLSCIYRHSRMCELLEVHPTEYLDVKRLFPSNTDMFQDPKTTFGVANSWRRLTRNDWTSSEILATLRFNSTSTTMVAEDHIGTVAAASESTILHAKLINKLRLSEEELKLFTDSGITLKANLNALDLAGLIKLEGYRDLREKTAAEHNALVNFFEWAAKCTNADGLAEKLADATGWPVAQVSSALEIRYPGLSRKKMAQYLCDITELASLADIMDMSKRIHMVSESPLSRPISVLFQIAVPTPPGRIDDDFTNASALQAMLSDGQAAECAMLAREKQRDALVKHVLQLPTIRNRKIHNADDLFDYFLLDAQMGPQMKTTRIKGVISSVQLFVQRCLLGLEKDSGVLSRHINKTKWAWMQQHNTWQAKRKANPQPEDQIDPSLRDESRSWIRIQREQHQRL
ncbi:hypothetical protein BGZ61DRAFT_542198 [Ilyonectria robusta]|uniref:uncharacterized protein n=1 Tax=Ilyonectria robusta TaxID=1079257 RepID=UPI001E8DF851|nr:uncharacterized protein BGZ61DRAFT_542198 [Ilyonectria robusta]KAH8650449.1 hypothetical protein BGZ61DRAFT_542198 [Ilyonectria robusta]